jgi:hypothetical protein
VICKHPEIVKIVAGWRPWFLPPRVGGVFHVKFMCLFVFDLFLSSYFANRLKDDVSYLDIELKLILEKLLVCITLFRLFLL